MINDKIELFRHKGTKNELKKTCEGFKYNIEFVESQKKILIVAGSLESKIIWINLNSFDD